MNSKWDFGLALNLLNESMLLSFILLGASSVRVPAEWEAQQSAVGQVSGGLYSFVYIFCRKSCRVLALY